MASVHIWLAVSGSSGKATKYWGYGWGIRNHYLFLLVGHFFALLCRAHVLLAGFRQLSLNYSSNVVLLKDGHNKKYIRAVT